MLPHAWSIPAPKSAMLKHRSALLVLALAVILAAWQLMALPRLAGVLLQTPEGSPELAQAVASAVVRALILVGCGMAGRWALRVLRPPPPAPEPTDSNY